MRGETATVLGRLKRGTNQAGLPMIGKKESRGRFGEQPAVHTQSGGLQDSLNQRGRRRKYLKKNRVQGQGPIPPDEGKFPVGPLYGKYSRTGTKT